MRKITNNMDLTSTRMLDELISEDLKQHPDTHSGSILLPLQLTVDHILDSPSENVLRRYVQRVENASALQVYANNLHIRKQLKADGIGARVDTVRVAGASADHTPLCGQLTMHAQARAVGWGALHVLRRSVNALVGTLYGTNGRHWLIDTYSSEGPVRLHVPRSFDAQVHLVYSAKKEIHDAVEVALNTPDSASLSKGILEFSGRLGMDSTPVPGLISKLFHTYDPWNVDDLHKLGLNLSPDCARVIPDKRKWYAIAGFSARLRILCPERLERIQNGKVDLDKIYPGAAYDDLVEKVAMPEFLTKTLKDSDGYHWIYLAELTYKPRDKQDILQGLEQI